MGYPTRFLSDDEQVLREFRPHWQAIAIPLGMLLAAIVVGVVVGIVADQLWWAVLAGVVIGLAFAMPGLLRWYFTKYVITDERIIVRSGVFARQGKEIPLEVINDVAFSQSLLERMFRSGDLLLESAGELGQSRFTDVPDPENVQTMIYKAREDRIGALNTGQSPTDALTALAQLHRDGILTDEEFAEKKQKLLGEI